MIAIHLVFTLFLCGYVASALQARYTLPPEQRPETPLLTFVVDPLTFFLVGLLTTLVFLINPKSRQLTEGEFLARVKWLDRALTVFVLGFWTMEIGTYFDLINMHQGLYPEKSGNWFMWNGYLDMMGVGEIVDTTVPTYKSAGMNALALLLLLAQLPFLFWGRALGYGRYRKKHPAP